MLPNLQFLVELRTVTKGGGGAAEIILSLCDSKSQLARSSHPLKAS